MKWIAINSPPLPTTDGAVAVFDHNDLLNGNQTIVGGGNFTGPPMTLSGFMTFELWLFGSSNNAGTTITLYLATVNIDLEPALFNTAVLQMVPFNPQTQSLTVAATWRRFYLDPVIAGIPFVPSRSAIFITTQGFVANTTITNSKMFCSPIY